MNIHELLYVLVITILSGYTFIEQCCHLYNTLEWKIEIVYPLENNEYVLLFGSFLFKLVIGNQALRNIFDGLLLFL